MRGRQGCLKSKAVAISDDVGRDVLSVPGAAPDPDIVIEFFCFQNRTKNQKSKRSAEEAQHHGRQRALEKGPPVPGLSCRSSHVDG